jgi:hypothetical protein
MKNKLNVIDGNPILNGRIYPRKILEEILNRNKTLHPLLYDINVLQKSDVTITPIKSYEITDDGEVFMLCND